MIVKVGTHKPDNKPIYLESSAIMAIYYCPQREITEICFGSGGYEVRESPDEVYEMIKKQVAEGVWHNEIS